MVFSCSKTKNIFLCNFIFPDFWFNFFVFGSGRGLVAESCLTLCDPTDCSLPGSSVRGILQARILEWATISFSRGSSWPRNQTQVAWITGRFFTDWATREASHRFGRLVICPNLGEVAFCKRGRRCPGSPTPTGHQSYRCTPGVPLWSAAGPFTSDGLTPWAVWQASSQSWRLPRPACAETASLLCRGWQSQVLEWVVVGPRIPDLLLACWWVDQFLTQLESLGCPTVGVDLQGSRAGSQGGWMRVLQDVSELGLAC